MIFKLAFLNLFRHRTRVALSLLTIAGACMSTIVFRGYSHYILECLRIYGAENQYGHIQLGSKKLWSPTNEKIKDQLFEILPELKKKVDAISDTVSVAPRLSLQGLLTNQDTQFGARIIGYDPNLEKTFKTSVELVDGEYLANPQDLEILLGSGLALRLKAKPGDSIAVVTQTVDGVINASDLTVRGIFRTTISDIDDQVAFVPIGLAQTLLDTNRVEVWMIRLKDSNRTFDVHGKLLNEIAAIQPDLTARTWFELADLYRQTEEFFTVQNFIVQLILSVLTVLAILNTVGMSVYERTGEIGTLRSLGVRQMGIVGQFMLEGVYLAILGGILGSILGFVGSFAINAAQFAIALPGASQKVTIVINLVPSAFALAIATSFVSTLLGTIIPAWRASRLSVVDALRRNI